jgi:hypothetical protein
MCGGRGTRLGTPIKCLTEIQGRPFMDWKLAQLRTQGFTQITLAVGPHFAEFFKVYQDSVGYICDDQTGVEAVARSLPQPMWWCNGDTLLVLGEHNQAPTLTNPAEGYGPCPTFGVATTHLIEPANVPGGWLDAGFYYGAPPFDEWRIVETRPYHINTWDDYETTDRYLSAYGYKFKGM